MRYEIIIWEIIPPVDETTDGKRIERLKQTVDDLDLEAVIKAINGFSPKKRGPKRKAA